LAFVGIPKLTANGGTEIPVIGDDHAFFIQVASACQAQMRTEFLVLIFLVVTTDQNLADPAYMQQLLGHVGIALVRVLLDQFRRKSGSQNNLAFLVRSQ
jgi:hypothetical protein